MTMAINIVIPDAGPLISLAKGGHLDLLLLFKPEVRILIADAVAHEVTRFAAKYPDAAVIALQNFTEGSHPISWDGSHLISS